jgi:hypothetical protein
MFFKIFLSGYYYSQKNFKFFWLEINARIPAGSAWFSGTPPPG